MRGGKTTLLMSLFDKLLQNGYSPIWVSFNGDTLTPPVDGECSHVAVCRAIGIALSSSKPRDKVEAQSWTCEPQVLLAFLDAQSDKKIVLLVDELNVLVRSEPGVSHRILGAFLRAHFLDRDNRLLVFTTHVPVSAGLDALLGEGEGSNRRALAIPLPISNDISSLRGMGSQCAALTPCQVAYYSGIPSLMYTMTEFPNAGFSMIDRFARLIKPTPTPQLQAAFLNEFFNGTWDSTNRELRVFDCLTTCPGPSQIRWILGYAGMVCDYLGIPEVLTLVKDLETYAKSEHSGKDWEIISHVALLLRCMWATHGTVHELLPFQVGWPLPKHVYAKAIPAEYGGPDIARDWWRSVPKACFPYLAVLWPQNSDFRLFDLMVCYQESANTELRVTGYQCKLGADTPNEDTPDDIPGILLRGDAPFSARAPTKRKGWRYLGELEIIDFLGRSLEGVYPSTWPKRATP